MKTKKISYTCPSCAAKAEHSVNPRAAAVYNECPNCNLVWAQRVPSAPRSAFVKREETELTFDLPYDPSPILSAKDFGRYRGRRF